jgi:hypothetical protein
MQGKPRAACARDWLRRCIYEGVSTQQEELKYDKEGKGKP